MTEDNRQSSYSFPSNIPIPDPSIATVAGLRGLRDEVKSWVDALQLLHETKIENNVTILTEKIRGAEDKTSNLDRVVQTRLAGSETALNAAMAAADKVTQEIKLNFGAVVNELKSGMTKQIDACNEKIEDLKKRVFESGGSQRGISQTVIVVIAGVSALASVVAIAISLTKGSPPVVYAQPGVLQNEPPPQPRLQRQTFPLVPTWDNNFYRIVQ